MSILTQKLGPFPVWVWGLVVAGGYLGYRLLIGGSGGGIGSGTVIGATSGDATGGGSGGGGDNTNLPVPTPGGVGIPAYGGIAGAVGSVGTAAGSAASGASAAVSSTTQDVITSPAASTVIGGMSSGPSAMAPSGPTISKGNQSLISIAPPSTVQAAPSPSLAVPGYPGATKLYPKEVIKYGSPVVVGGGKTSSGTYVEPHVISLGGGTNPFAVSPVKPTAVTPPPPTRATATALRKAGAKSASAQYQPAIGTGTPVKKQTTTTTTTKVVNAPKAL